MHKTHNSRLENIRNFTMALMATSLLSACVTVKKEAAKFETLSCAGLDVEQARQEVKLKRAKQDGLVALGVGILVDETLGDIDNELSLIDEEDARTRLKAIKQVKASKGC